MVRSQGGSTRWLQVGASVVAIMAGAQARAQAVAPASAPADAPQATAPADGDEIETVIVTGVRRSLASAQDIKRNADTVVDSISANDIGAFPDRSVAESLQRIAGVTVSRFASPTDTQHLTGDPGQVVIRGLTQVETQFNGRQSFSVTPYRGLSFADVTTELLSQVDVYKNQTADLIEGGIAGTVDLHTRLPFEQAGRLFAFTADGAYEDLQGSVDPDVSGLYSDRWRTSAGEFGLLLDGAFSQTRTNSQNEQLGQTVKVDSTYFGTPGTTYLPGGIYDHDAHYDRTRFGASVAGQWQSLDGRMTATVQYNLSDYENINNELGLTQAFTQSAYDNNASARYACNTQACDARRSPTGNPADYPYDYTGYYAPTPGTGPFVFDGGGQFVYGTPSDMTDNGFGAYTGLTNSAGLPFFGSGARYPQQTWTQGIYDRQHDRTQDLSGHFHYTPTDSLTLDLDYQHIFAESDEQYRSSEFATFSTVTYDNRSGHPHFLLNTLDPYNFNPSPGGGGSPRNYVPRDNDDHYSDGTGSQDAVRADVKYKVGATWLDSLQFGLRYSDREETYASTPYNWGSTYASWNSASPSNAYLSNAVYAPVVGGTNRFDGYYNGALTTNTPLIVPSTSLLANRSAYEALFVQSQLLNQPLASNGGSNWHPVCSGLGARATESISIGEGCYAPNEVLDLTEQTEAGYVRLNFGGPAAHPFGAGPGGPLGGFLGGVTLSGNAGVRVIRTEVSSDGGRAFSGTFTPIVGGAGCSTPPKPTDNIACFANAGDAAFEMNPQGGFSGKTSFWDVLPSFNVRFAWNTWVSRFGYSRGLSRPDVGVLRNFQTITPTLLNTGAANGGAASYAIQWTGNAGNPNLRPTQADNLDFTIENYFGKVGYFSIDFFYKQFHDYVISGSGFEDVTNNGVTRSVLFTQPVNAPGGNLKGVEISMQRTADFLPGVWSGFGFQGSVTLVESRGIDSTGLVGDTGGGSVVRVFNNPINPRALVGISPLSYTLTGFYDRGPLSARIAYAYRDDYLLSVTDSNNPYPFWQKGNGYLDGSIQYKLTNNLILTVDASNITGVETIVEQQVESGKVNGRRNLQPYAFQQIDRRVGAGLRLKF